jgi:Tfp pilus assembly protein FimT
MSSTSALTLIELIITITIFALVTAVVIPAFSNFNQRQQLTRAVEQVRTDLRAMQSQAVSGAEGSQWAVIFNAGADTYQMGQYAAGSLVDPQTKNVPGDVDLTTSPAVVFDRLTGESVNGQHQINLSLSGTTRTVTVNSGGNIE